MYNWNFSIKRLQLLNCNFENIYKLTLMHNVNKVWIEHIAKINLKAERNIVEYLYNINYFDTHIPCIQVLQFLSQGIYNT